jgi:malate dehydrogenase (oxaloacetate-decarboxylating)(NADP+)
VPGYSFEQSPDGSRRLLTKLRGKAVLANTALNKGGAFSLAEREGLGLSGLLPAAVIDLETHVRRASEFLSRMEDPLSAYVMLLNLMYSNRTVFYATIRSDPDRFLPIVYTPTVGDACEQFGQLMARPSGLYIPITHADSIRELLRNWPGRDVRFTVVTDGSRVLGLGDLGADGMGIPVGKLALYTAVAGVPPRFTIPITLDVGTDNEKLLNDPFYLGLKQRRVTGEAYDAFIEEFVEAFIDVFPGACIQWEDFNISHAEPILAKYQDRLCTFNDDIQGTAGVAVAGLYAACRAKGEQMADQRILFLGAGSAATGIANLFVQAVVEGGLARKDAYDLVRLFDKRGLCTTDRTDLADFQTPFAVEAAACDDFVQCIEEFRPTAIIGVSTATDAFNADVLAAMSAINARPIIFPLSNPTSHAETTAEKAYAATNNRALFASGSPFPPLEVDGGTVHPSQGNNVYIFPAMGLALLATRARRVTGQMFLVAAQALSDQISMAELEMGNVFPPRSRITQSADKVALAVAEYIFDSGYATVDKPDDLAGHLKDIQYVPEYLPVIPV